MEAPLSVCEELHHWRTMQLPAVLYRCVVMHSAEVAFSITHHLFGTLHSWGDVEPDWNTRIAPHIHDAVVDIYNRLVCVISKILLENTMVHVRLQRNDTV